MRRLLLLLVLLAPQLAPLPAQAERFNFVAFGDMPYCIPSAPDRCDAEIGRVARLMGIINTAVPDFSLFLGDTKGGSEICTDERLLRAISWMGLLQAPLVYTVGDNEWTDCWQNRAGRYDQMERLALVRDRFFPDDQSLGRRTMTLTRQADVDPAHPIYVENARWEHGGVVFVTAHIPGSNNNLQDDPRPGSRIIPPPGARAEYAARNAANLAWIGAAFDRAEAANARALVLGIQADMFYPQRCGRGTRTGFEDTITLLRERTNRFDRPVLLLNGDSHFFLEDHPIPEAPKLHRMMVPGEQDVRAVRVSVDTEAADPFSFLPIGVPDHVAPPSC
ncbi:hypothetical protein C8P66_11937 [Humitalea rosea]|uniref:Calcineurin-like phosphoesterase family protein n=1 Tax=Humitalea rosea TaxID=990373 RepID=A0A2W7IAP6_9PROT|nr:hypothetical protein [Humitalea rosea]PZW42145.1 hypothetical protein C8P66_11937 [Humitalea rosea]